MGYTTFPNLASSSGTNFKSLTGFQFVKFLAYVFSSGAVSQINSAGSVSSNSYFDYLFKRKLINNDVGTAMSSLTTYKACATVIDTVYMAMDITIPAKSAYDVSNLNWEFDIGTSASGDYYSVLTGSRYIAFDCNVYVDGKAVYQGRSFGLGSPDYTLRSGYVSLSNGSLSQLLGNQSYYLSNSGTTAKTYTVGVELVPVVQHENFSDIASVDGYGNTATSWGAPAVCYFGSNTQTKTTWANLFKVSSAAVHHTSANTPSAARVDSKTSAALAKLSTNGYYYVLYLNSKSTEDKSAEAEQKIIDALNSIISNQNTLKTTSSSILTKIGTMITNQTSMVNNQKTMITNQNNIYNTEKQILATDKSILATEQSIANALLTNPYVIEFFDPSTGKTSSSTQQGLDDALLAQGNAVADATGRLAYMTGSDMDIGIKDGMSDREEAIAGDFLGEDSKGTFTKDDTGQLSDVSGEMKDMLNTGASAGDAFDSFNEVFNGGSEYSWFSSTTQQNLNPGASTYSADNYNYDYYYSNQEEVRRRLGLDG
ncbi:MAG: hypothetical protein [Inoviridae sp.]|nr:MAG: hypothetical protein [Inoviridae sp.]